MSEGDLRKKINCICKAHKLINVSLQSKGLNFCSLSFMKEQTAQSKFLQLKKTFSGCLIYGRHLYVPEDLNT